jgi:1,4-dihydroxy-2-naphthoate octaprenyltransferase
VIPAALGAAVAVVHGGVRLHVPHALLAAVGAACIHAASNLLNDYFDFRAGVDTPTTLGASRGMLVTGRLTPREVLIESFVFWALGAALALYFTLAVGPVLLPLFAGGLILGAGYTPDPLRLKYRALGDACVFLAFGIGVTLGAYAVQTGKLSWTAVCYGLPMGVLIWAIVHANNLRDVATDRAAHIRTLAMTLGAARARWLYIGLLVTAYVVTVLFAVFGVYKPWALLAGLSLPLAFGAARIALQAREGTGAPPAAVITLDVRTAQLQMAFGVLLISGLIVSAVL